MCASAELAWQCLQKFLFAIPITVPMRRLQAFWQQEAMHCPQRICNKASPDDEVTHRTPPLDPLLDPAMWPAPQFLDQTAKKSRFLGNAFHTGIPTSR